MYVHFFKRAFGGNARMIDLFLDNNRQDFRIWYGQYCQRYLHDWDIFGKFLNILVPLFISCPRIFGRIQFTTYSFNFMENTNVFFFLAFSLPSFVFGFLDSGRATEYTQQSCGIEMTYERKMSGWLGCLADWFVVVGWLVG